MTLPTQRMALVRGGYIRNLNTAKQRSYNPVKGMLNYIAHGRYRAQQTQRSAARGEWFDHQGKPHSHQAVLQWAKEKVHRLGYDHAYQLLLSTRHGHLSSADFNQVLQQGSSFSQVYEWRAMTHTDTNNLHAHVLLFRQQRLTSSEYKRWQQAMQGVLTSLQVDRWQTYQLSQSQSATAKEAAFDISL